MKTKSSGILLLALIIFAACTNFPAVKKSDLSETKVGSESQRNPSSAGSLRLANQEPAFDYELDLDLRDRNLESTALVPFQSFVKTTMKVRINFPAKNPKRGQTVREISCLTQEGDKEVFTNTLEDYTVEIKLKPEYQSCELKIFAQDRSLIHTLKISAEEERFPFMNKLYAYEDRCELPTKNSAADAREYMWTSPLPFLSCPTEIQGIELMDAGYEAFNLRWKVLVGEDLPKDVFEKNDINYEPNWSNIPKLDFVWISSLVWKADFYGAMMAKAVKKQAERGALVKVLYSNLLMEKIDKRFVNKLKVQSENLQVDDYEFRKEDFNILNKLRKFHRSMHAKLFATYSVSDSTKNLVIGGGSNIYDGFLFYKPSNVTGGKEFIHYTDRTQRWAHFSDTDFVVRDPHFTEQVLAQLLRLWSRTDSDNLADATSITAKDVPSSEFLDRAGDKSFARNIISVPYTDEKNLEKLYVDLFDSAKQKIMLVTPLFRFTKPIAAAVQRAFERDVEIEVITNFTVEGTPWPKLHTEMNRRFANKYYGKVKARKWNKYGDLLHAKIVKIDDKAAFLGSVNINHRSFYHDIENGLLLTGPKALAEVDKQINRFVENSVEVDKKFRLSIEHQLLYDLLQGLL